jgi:hypothetical protein
MHNSKLLVLDYEDDSPGASGIGRVELWGTRDGGRTWQSYALDNDSRSPLFASIEEEGIYGFRIVVRDATGRGDTPPASGEPPEVWIGVDLTKPHAKILTADRGAGPEAGALVIRWEADDWMLAADPVSLFFREGAGGPWTPIATGLENTGHFSWTPDRPLTQGVYLRLEVRDEAGNVGADETTNTISFERYPSTGRISGVRSLSRTSQRTPPRWLGYH